jgi:hypothetical protein
MTPAYPISDQRPLQEVAKRGPMGLRRSRRDPDELPPVAASQVLVYRVGGEYVVDNGRRGLDDEQVVGASHVSVVDLTRNTPVRVELGIPSAEASEFTVQVTFLCTVTDATTVVREGQHDAGVFLLNYLRSHHRVFELGLDHKLSAINTVRRDVQAQVQAYTQLKPPTIPGMSVALASVEVRTPEELVEYYGKLRGLEFDQVIAAGGERNTQLLARMRRLHEQEQERQRQAYEQELARRQREFALREFAEVSQVVGDDPLKAAMYAHTRGELTTTELAAQLQAAKDRDRADAAEWAALVRQDRRQDLEWDRTREHERELAEREERRLQLEWDRDRAHEREVEARDERLRKEASERDERLEALKVRLDVLKEVAKHGHLDEIYIDVERLIRNLAGSETVTPALDATAAGDQRQELEDSQTSTLNEGPREEEVGNQG